MPEELARAGDHVLGEVAGIWFIEPAPIEQQMLGIEVRQLAALHVRRNHFIAALVPARPPAAHDRVVFLERAVAEAADPETSNLASRGVRQIRDIDPIAVIRAPLIGSQGFELYCHL